MHTPSSWLTVSQLNLLHGTKKQAEKEAMKKTKKWVAQKKRSGQKSMESVLTKEETLWWERFVEQLGFKPTLREGGNHELVCLAKRWRTGRIFVHLESGWYNYTASQKNVPPLACYNFDAHEWILIFFGRNVSDKVGNQKTFYCASSNNLHFCTTRQNAETRKSYFTQLDCVTRTVHLCAIFLKEKIVICDLFDSV